MFERPHHGAWRRRVRSSGIALAGLALLAATAAADDFDFLDPRLSAETVVDLDDYQAVAIAWAPGGRLLVAERPGIVRLVKDGVLQPTPFVDLTGRVNLAGDRGLLGLAVDPDWEENGWVYLLYTYEGADPPEPASSAPRTSRLTRVTADPENLDVALPGSEVVILGTIGEPPCSAHPPGADCLPSDTEVHTVGTVRATPEGWLFVGNGDGSSATFVDPLALRAQDLDSASGKILRVMRDGSAPGDNPFHDGSDSIRSKVWAYGLRNPFRFALDPELGEPVIGDVGWGAFEEIDRGRGANFGWPCFEGNGPQGLYAATPFCQGLAPSSVQAPLHTYGRAVGGSITMGTFVTGEAYPDDLRGRLLFGDYVSAWLALADWEEGEIGDVVRLAEHGERPVAIEQGPDGLLYYLDFPTGRVRRIVPPGLVARAAASPLWGLSPLAVDFSSAGSSSPEPGELAYHWELGDGSTSDQAEPSHLYASTEPTAFDVVLTVEDGVSPAATARLRIVVGSTPPSAAVTAPVEGATVDLWDTLQFTGTGTDPEQGPLPGSALRWSVLHRHDAHVHGLTELAGEGGSVRIPDFGPGEHSIELHLRARDATGLEGAALLVVPVLPALFGDDFEHGHPLKWSAIHPPV